MHCGRASIVMMVLGLAACAKPAMNVEKTSAAARVRPGITVLLDDSWAHSRKRVALITNQNGVDATGVSDIDLLRGPRRRRPA